MANTPVTADHLKKESAHQDIVAENQDSAKASDRNDSRTQRNVAARSQADKLEDRLIDFAVRIIKLAAGLPKTAAARHIAGQT